MSISKRNHFREQVRLQSGLAVASDRNAAATEIIDSNGDITADITGNVTGDVTGDVTGSVTAEASDTVAIADADALTVNSVIVPQHIEVSYYDDANGDLADQAFFLATRAYQVVAISEIHATAGNDAGAVNLQVTKDTSTDAPGAGTDLLTDNSNAGFDLKGAANTVQNGTLHGTVSNLQLAAGDRLSVDFAGTLTSLAGVLVTVTLKRI